MENNFNEYLNEILKKNTQNKPVIIFMMGVPASGKSTLIKEIQNKLGINEVISIDNLAEDYAEKNNINYRAAITLNFKIFKSQLNKRVEELRLNPSSFIWDQINSRKNLREGKLGMFKNKCFIVGICMNPEGKDLINRMINRKLFSDKDLSAAMVNDLHQDFQFPELKEGFDEIILVSSNKLEKVSENENLKLNKLDLSKESMDDVLRERGLLEQYYDVYKQKADKQRDFREKSGLIKKM